MANIADLHEQPMMSTIDHQAAYFGASRVGSAIMGGLSALRERISSVSLPEELPRLSRRATAFVTGLGVTGIFGGAELTQADEQQASASVKTAHGTYYPTSNGTVEAKYAYAQNRCDAIVAINGTQSADKIKQTASDPKKKFGKIVLTRKNIDGQLKQEWEVTLNKGVGFCGEKNDSAIIQNKDGSVIVLDKTKLKIKKHKSGKRTFRYQDTGIMYGPENDYGENFGVPLRKIK
jgi:hypothetical protein